MNSILAQEDISDQDKLREWRAMEDPLARINCLGRQLDMNSILAQENISDDNKLRDWRVYL